MKHGLIRKIKREILLSVVLLALAVLAGVFFAHFNPEEAGIAVQELARELEAYSAEDPATQAMVIFIHNSQIDFLLIVAGVFFGIVPLLILLFNGYYMGIVLYVASAEIGAGTVLLATIPHGILEIPAIIISCAYGFWLGTKLYRRAKYGEPLKQHLKDAIYAFVVIILPLNFVAAILEVFVSAALIRG